MPLAPASEKRIPRWLLAWALLAAASLALHSACWGSWAPPALGDALKPAANVLQMLALPGWVVTRLAATALPIPFSIHATLAYAMAAAGWLIAARVVLSLRARWLAPARPVSLARRRFLADGTLGLTGLAGAGVLGEGVLREPWDVRVRRYIVPVQSLPPALDGLRIVQLSDTHLGPRMPVSHLRDVVNQALALRPGLIALTGDYIHMGVSHIAPAADLFRPLVASGIPVVGVLGNHDWYANGPAMSRALAAIGVRMIDNDRVFLRDGRLIDAHADDALCIAGLGDLEEDATDVVAALGGLPDVPAIVLAHNPDTAELPAWARPRDGARVALMLSGHTHGGQVYIPGLGTPIVPSNFGQKYAGGLVRGPHFPVIVSRGIGMSLLPVRFLVPPEIVVVTLSRA